MASEKQATKSNYSGLLIVISVFTLIHWLILIFQIPIFDNLPDWVFMLRVVPVNLLWICFAFFIFGLAVILFVGNTSYSLKLAVIILIGIVLQYSFALSKGKGLDVLTIRLTGQNHAEFAKVAVRPVSLRFVAMEYETLLDEKYYGFLPSKPPGTLLFYILTNKVAEKFFPSEAKKESLEHLAIFAALTWPFISCLTIIPLFFLARYLFDDPELGVVASIFYISIPSLNLVTMVPDQVLYPLLALSSVFLVILAYKKNNLLLAFIGGIVFYGVLYFSFGLAVISFFFLVPIFVNQFSQLRSYVISIQHTTAISLGVAVANFAVYFLLNYNISVRYIDAIAHHVQWKGWENNLRTYLNASLTNITEFSIWIGLPITILFLLSLYNALRELILHKYNMSSMYNIILGSIFIFLLVFGKTKAEVARLWLFLVPFLCISVGNYIKSQHWLRHNKINFTIIILLLQIGTTIFTHLYMGY